MVKTSRANATESRARRNSDLAGLAFFFAGAMMLLWLCWPQRELVPTALETFLRLLAGSGAYAVPVILMFIGTMFLLGYSRLSFSHSSLGSLLLFLAFVAWRHIAVPVPPEIATLPGASVLTVANPIEPAWLDSHLTIAGGYCGAILGTVFIKVLGLPGTYFLLIFMLCAGTVLIVERPFIELLNSLFGKPATAGYNAAKQGVAVVKERRREAKLLPSPKDGRGAGGEGSDDDPSLRRRGLFPFRRDNGSSEAAIENRKSKIQNRPDPHPTIQGPSGLPVKINGGITRTKKSGAPGDQPAIPMLDTETGGENAFKLPPINLLQESPPLPKKAHSELQDKIKILEQTLEQFNIQANVVEIAHGPTVTRYEIQLAPGVKVSKIVSLADNLAMSLAAIDVRVEAPIPGKSAIGVEVPNANPAIVALRECIDNPEFWNAPSKLTFALGKDVGGQTRYADLTKMPHLLVAGSTNAGKSVCLNTLIASILYRATPAEVKFIMVDPKRVELSLWDNIPHLMHPVVKDVKQTAGIFRAALKEMERRYDMFARLQTRNIDGYNQRVSQEERIPYIVIVVDELADLMMTQGAEIETSICRLAQLARATGIHLVIATQRPSVDVITGLIKANISSRIAFAVSSAVDSRTILDMNGAERLIGRGDMLFMPIDASKPMRIQGCYLSEAETNALVKYLKEQDAPSYTIAVVDDGRSAMEDGGSFASGDDEDDEFYERAVRLVVTNGQASTSMLQRRFKIGYTRAARIVDLMEERGIVGPPDGAKPREILVGRDEVDMIFRTGRYGIPKELLE